MDHNTELILRGWEQLCQNFPQQKTNIGKYSIDFTPDKEIEDKSCLKMLFLQTSETTAGADMCAIFKFQHLVFKIADWDL